MNGTAKELRFPDDLGSEVVREVVDELNRADIPINTMMTVANGATGRAILGSWLEDAWIRNVRVANVQNNAIVNVATRIAIKAAAPNDLDLSAGPAAPQTVLDLLAFNVGGGLPAKTAYWADQFDTTNVGTKTGEGKGVKIPKGWVVYAEVVNNEGAARTFGIQMDVTITNLLNLQPGAMQRIPRHPMRDTYKQRGMS